MLIAGFRGLLLLTALAGADGIKALLDIEASNDHIRDDFVLRIRADVYRSGTDVRDYLLEPEPGRAEGHRYTLVETRRDMEDALGRYRKLLREAEAEPFAVLTRQLEDYWRVLGIGLGEVVVKLRDFEGGEELALSHAVADIDLDLLYVTGDLGHHVDFLERAEFGREDDGLGEALGGCFRDGNGLRLVGPSGAGGCRLTRARGQEYGEKGQKSPHRTMIASAVPSGESPVGGILGGGATVGANLLEGHQRIRLLPESLDEGPKKEPSYADFLDELVGSEVEARHSRYLRARLQLVHLQFVKKFDQFEFGFQPSIDERLLLVVTVSSPDTDTRFGASHRFTDDQGALERFR
jgi:hypothetical protein